MIDRIGYAIRESWRHRFALCDYAQPSHQVSTVLELDLHALYAKGIRVLVLDFDGVLASHGEEEPDSKIQTWLRDCLEVFGQDRVFILSNRPSFKRWNFFSEQFKGIHLVHAKRKKPYPDGVQEILTSTHADPQSVLLIDDRLLTGVLAGLIAKISVLYVINPWVDIQKRPIQECFFMGLRRLDRLVVWLYQKIA